jgi:hypothetical protein
VVSRGTSRPERRLLLEDRPLQHVAEQEHRGEDGQEGEERRGVPVLEQQEDEIRAEHREIAVREVDDPHQAEHQREPAGEQPVEAAEQDALDDVVDPDHTSTPWVRRSPK